MEKGLRYNENKIRFHLLEPFAIEKLAEVFDVGAKKYSPHNWLKGIEWSKMIDSLKRHLSEFEKGIDYDSETGLLHMQHLAWNAMALVSYYKYYPQGDDRIARFLKTKRVGLDIDGVLADFNTGYAKRFNIKNKITFWNFDRKMKERMEELKNDGSFWLNLPLTTNPNDILIEPVCYITARPIETKEFTIEWLSENGFPNAPVYFSDKEKTKSVIAKENKIDIFVDDSYENFKELTCNDVFCYLYDTEYNKNIEIGHRRIKSLKELKLW